MLVGVLFIWIQLIEGVVPWKGYTKDGITFDSISCSGLHSSRLSQRGSLARVVQGVLAGTPCVVTCFVYKWEIDPERFSVVEVDIPDLDSETVDGPADTEMDREEDLSKPTTRSAMDTTEWIKNVLRTETSKEPSIEPISSIHALPTENQIAALQAELVETSRHFHSSCQASQLETTRADRLAAEVAQMREILEAQQHGVFLQHWLGMISSSANETPAEA
ncbi:hypothetical protein M9H77_11751 [Catharanthus roseus]|uniref:Uncharacterized protein n=1 Tax=Catharanthus roseus TaxID=4058 RepID=A0ACC0BFJ5_CATRO|nr:hypothetical protein M9H77_11751 [Catharanthus roseus]